MTNRSEAYIEATITLTEQHGWCYKVEGEGILPIATESDWDSAAHCWAFEFGPIPEGRLVGPPTKWLLMDAYGDAFAVADCLGGRRG